MTDNTPFTSEFLKAVHSAIYDEVESAVESALDEAKLKLDDEIPKIVAGLGLKMIEGVSMERNGSELLIHVDMGDTPST